LPGGTGNGDPDTLTAQPVKLLLPFWARASLPLSRDTKQPVFGELLPHSQHQPEKVEGTVVPNKPSRPKQHCKSSESYTVIGSWAVIWELT